MRDQWQFYLPICACAYIPTADCYKCCDLSHVGDSRKSSRRLARQIARQQKQLDWSRTLQKATTFIGTRIEQSQSTVGTQFQGKIFGKTSVIGKCHSSCDRLGELRWSNLGFSMVRSWSNYHIEWFVCLRIALWRAYIEQGRVCWND